MKKVFVAWVMAILLVLGMPMKASADFSVDTRKSVAVVYTCLDMDRGEYGFGWGTGFFVGKTGENPTYLLTNYHVISDFVNYGAGELIGCNINGVDMQGRSKVRVYYDSNEYNEAYVVGYSESKDVALLKLASATDKRKPLPLCSPTDAMVGSQIYAVGYPGLSENIFAGSTTSWSESDASVTGGTFSRIFTTEGTGRVNIQIDCVIQHGNSGGPLVNDAGEAIGINTWGFSADSESVNYAVSIDEGITLLRLYGVEFTTSSGTGENTGDTQMTDTPNITEGSQSIDGGTEAIENDIAQNTPSSSAVTEGNEEKSKANLGMWIAIAVAVLAVVGAGIFIILSKKKKPQPEPVQPTPVSPEAFKRPVVRSMSAQHQGMRVSLSDRQILIGRSKECTIVFKEGTPGVSGRHCSLAWDASSRDFVLTDLKSTYGTYLQNGQRLNAGVPYHLRAGECFYLGENANMLSVNLE